MKITQNVAFEFWHFPPIFGLFKTDLSGNTVWPQASGFQKLAKIDHFGHFKQLLSTQNVNVARFARSVECDFFCDFQTPWSGADYANCSSGWSSSSISTLCAFQMHTRVQNDTAKRILVGQISKSSLADKDEL